MYILKNDTQAPQEDKHTSADTKLPENRTGIPDAMKEDAERLSGVSLEDVQIHYASPEPEKYEALAFTEGNHIYIAPGQEKHLGHEVWHAVQQKQRRVKGTDYGGIFANFDRSLETEADSFDRKWRAANLQRLPYRTNPKTAASSLPFQYLLAKSRACPNPLSNGKTFRFLNPVMSNYAPPKDLRSSTLLRATLDGIDLFHAWSMSGIHAEDWLCTFLTKIEDQLKAGTPPTDSQSLKIYEHLSAVPAPHRQLSLILSSSPCSSTTPHATRLDGSKGCLELLEDLHKNYNYTISILANNWYLFVDNSVHYPAGITITISRTALLASPLGFDPGLHQALADSGKEVRQFRKE